MNPPPGLGDDDESIGPPPGIDIPQKQKKLPKKPNQSYPQPSLESLNLELKVTVQDQQFDQIPLNQDYLEPSVNNLIPYNGFLCDTSGSDSLGIWDSKMKLIKECKGLVENMPNKTVSLHDKLFLYNECFESLFLIEPEVNKKTTIIDMPLQAFCVSDHTNPRLIGVSDGTFHLWRLPQWGKPNQKEPIFNNIPSKNKDIELQKTIPAKYEEFDDLLILQNGLIFTKQKKAGEVYLVDFDNNLVEELQTTAGCAVTCWTAISYDRVAFASNKGQIVVTRFVSPKTSDLEVVISQTKEDIHHGLCFANGLLFSISKNAALFSWNIQTGAKVRHAEVKFCPGVYSLQTMNQDIIIAEHKEKKDFILFNTNLEKQFTYKARVKRVLHCCASSNDQFVAIVQQSGVLYDEEVVFHSEIEIFPFDSKLDFPRRREIDNLEVKTVQFLNDNTLQFILKIVKSVNPILVRWNFITNEYVETELLVEKYKSCQLYQIRSVFSYDFHNPPSQQFNLFAPKRIDDGSLSTGISVYDENIKRLLKVTFQQQFNADVFGMPTQNLLYVLNNKNQIEVWDVTTQQQVQKADCRPNVIKSIKFSSQYLFLNAQQEWIIRDLKLSQICKTKGGLVNRCQFMDQKCIIHQNVNLYEWDLVTNTCTRLGVSFGVNDFCIVQKKVLAIGDSNIKML